MVQKFQKPKFLKVVLLSLVTGLFLGSCLEDTSCGQNMESGLLFSAYRITLDSVTQEPVITRDMNKLFVFLDRNKQDTLYPRATDTLALVPIELNDTITSLYFEKDSVLDEIRIIHTYPEAAFVDVNCGFVPSYEIKNGSFTNVNLDSVLIINPTVNTDVFQTNILLFY